MYILPDPRSLHAPVPVYQRPSDYPDIIALVSLDLNIKPNTTDHTLILKKKKPRFRGWAAESIRLHGGGRSWS
jgi:hypothetical protein